LIPVFDCEIARGAISMINKGALVDKSKNWALLAKLHGAGICG